MARAGRSVRPLRRVVTLAMDLLVALAVALLVHLVVSFFGQLASQPWAGTITGVTRRLIVPLGLPRIGTPFGGAFDLNAAVSMLVLLFGEWLLGLLRRRV